MDTIIQPVTTRAKRGPYRQHGDEFKRAAVARTLVAGVSVSLIVRELNVNTNQLFNWRKRSGAGAPTPNGTSGKLVAVTVVDTPSTQLPVPNAAPGVIVLSVGPAQLRLEGQVDAATLALLLARLLP